MFGWRVQLVFLPSTWKHCVTLCTFQPPPSSSFLKPSPIYFELFANIHLAASFRLSKYHTILQGWSKIYWYHTNRALFAFKEVVFSDLVNFWPSISSCSTVAPIMPCLPIISHDNVPHNFLYSPYHRWSWVRSFCAVFDPTMLFQSFYLKVLSTLLYPCTSTEGNLLIAMDLEQNFMANHYTFDLTLHTVTCLNVTWLSSNGLLCSRTCILSASFILWISACDSAACLHSVCMTSGCRACVVFGMHVPISKMTSV